MEIRKASVNDINKINKLLFQVAKIHADGRPDIFKANTKKYNDKELIDIINCENTTIFVATENEKILGYAFCIYQIIDNSSLLQNKKTLYIDDLCVDKDIRRRNIGTKLYEFVEDFALKNNFDNITLNVWDFNESAYKFYLKRGMNPQKIVMEKILK